MELLLIATYRAVALIDIDEDTSGYNIPGGAAAQVLRPQPIGSIRSVFAVVSRK